MNISPVKRKSTSPLSSSVNKKFKADDSETKPSAYVFPSVFVWLPHATRTIASVLAAERRTLPQKRSVCGGDEPQPIAHLSHKLQCACQSLKIIVFFGKPLPATKTRPPVAKQSGQCARALRVQSFR